jgi:hypothetical protein
MGHCCRPLLRGTALVVFLTAMPASAQYLYLDATGDGLNYWREVSVENYSVVADCLDAASTVVDVYYVTNQNADGSPASCDSGDSLKIGSYEFLLGWSGSGIVTATGWSDNMGFTQSGIGGGDGTFTTAGQEIWVGRTGEFQAPGLYKVGTLSITVLGTPYLFFKSASDGTFPQAQTLFGSACPGLQQDNKLRLGSDFPRGAAFPADCRGSTIGVQSTTWGKIKQRYR